VARRRTRSPLRTLAAFISAFCLFITLIVGGAFLWLRSSLPQTDGTISVAGLDQPVTIVRDDDGIPHIRAHTTADAYFSLGFVHAQDRLAQMEFYRRVGQGRLAEIIGKAGLASDRFARTLGYERLARASLAQLSPEARAAVDSYTAGVNAWLDTHRGALPPEFVALRFAPERWRPEDCLIWSKLMATQLSNWPVMIARLRYAAALSPEDESDLFPPYPANAPLTIDDALGRHAALNSGGVRVTDHLSAPLPLIGADPSVPIEASNSFVLSGQHTVSGKPLLASDPHLGFSAPNLWYLVRIDAPGMTLAGASVPGVPFLIIGHNGHVAWGLTTTGAETDALFAERLEGTDGTSIVGPNGPEALSIRTETIAVSAGEPERLTVRASRHGPILSDIMSIPGLGPGEIAALNAPALRPDDRTGEAFYRINHAGSAEEFRSALRDFQSPMQNVTFADTAGSIGFVTAGRMPIRAAAPEKGLRPGWTDADDVRFIPFEEMPQVLDPPRGEIVNANNKVVGDSYPHFLGTFWAGVERAERIEQRLDSAERFDVPSFAAVQTDALSLGARELLPRLLPLVANAGLDPAAGVARDRLRQWDGTMSRDAPEPLIYHAWIAALARSLAAGRGQGDNPAAVATIARPAALMRMLDAPERWCSGIPAKDATAEADENASCQPLVAGAFAAAIDMLTKNFGNDPLLWRWGEAHRAVFAHRLFMSVPLLDRLTTIDIATDGDDSTVNRGTIGFGARHAGSIFYRPPLYPGVHGPGLRAIMDLADLDNSLFMQATGQSGNPLSSHYGDLAERWAAGRYILLAPLSETSDAVHGLVLTPEERKP
jgi:penicillin amidase